MRLTRHYVLDAPKGVRGRNHLVAWPNQRQGWEEQAWLGSRPNHHLGWRELQAVAPASVGGDDLAQAWQAAGRVVARLPVTDSLDAALAEPDGTHVTCPNYDFVHFERISRAGNRSFILRPIVILDAQPITVPLNPHSLPIVSAAVGLNVERMQGRLIPTKFDHLPDRNWQSSPIRILDSGSRRNMGRPRNLHRFPTFIPHHHASIPASPLSQNVRARFMAH